MARKRRTAVEDIQPAGPESPGIDLHAGEPRGANGSRELLECDATLPPWNQMPVQLDAGEIAMVTHPQVARDTQIAERILRPLDLTQTILRDGSAIR